MGSGRRQVEMQVHRNRGCSTKGANASALQLKRELSQVNIDPVILAARFASFLLRSFHLQPGSFQPTYPSPFPSPCLHRRSLIPPLLLLPRPTYHFLPRFFLYLLVFFFLRIPPGQFLCSFTFSYPFPIFLCPTHKSKYLLVHF